MSLLEARQFRTNFRKLLQQDIDPQEHRKAQRLQQRAATENTFEKVAALWFKTKEAAGLTRHTLNDIWPSMSSLLLTDRYYFFLWAAVLRRYGVDV
ncbi:hypothetical protein ACFFJN_18940 [Erwinia mallotivora]|uniref:hypothetical protein n=1 Tax=Erwinia mallotivora TaxID=69222 RepID=UPI0035EBFA44